MELFIAIMLAIALKVYKDYQETMAKKAKIIGYDTRTGIALYEGEKIVGYDTQTGRPIIKGREEPKPKEKEDKGKISNSILMIVGAGLIVFATLVFLTSSWDNIPSIIKPFMLVFIQLIFYASYYICDKKLDIPKTGKVFKFLAFMFIPIVLISLSCFDLVGEFSITGEYYNYFFAASFIISDIIFKIYTSKNDDIVLKRAGYFLELAALFCICDQINNDLVVCLLFPLFTVIYTTLIKRNILDDKTYYHCNLGASIAIMIVSYLLTKDSNYYYIPFVIYSIEFFILHFIEKDENRQLQGLYFFLVNYMTTVSFTTTLDIPKYPILLLSLLPIILFAKLTKKETFSKILQVTIATSTFLILFINLFDASNNYYDTLALAAGFINNGLLLCLFNNEIKPIYKYLTYLSFTLLLMNICTRLDISEVMKYIPLLVAVIVYLLEIVCESLKDKYSKVAVLGTLYLETFVLGIETLTYPDNYSIILPFALIVAYIKLEKMSDNYIIFPAICSFSLFSKENTTISVLSASALTLIYCLLSILKKEFNAYTVISGLAIIIGLPSLDASPYVVYAILVIWSFVHYFLKTEYKALYKITGIISFLGIYFNILKDFDIEYDSLYILGSILALLAVTRWVFQEESDTKSIIEIMCYIIIALVSLVLVSEPTDAILMIVVYFFIVLLTFALKYKEILYCSIITMIIHVIKQTLEFWSSVPIYIYVLIIGVVLILFAMFDERLNIVNKKKETEEKNEEKKE